MNIVRERKINFHEEKEGVRILGYLEKESHTISMYILVYFFGDRKVCVNLVVGDWGAGDRIQSGKVAIFSVLILEPEPHFMFYDPNESQVRAYGKMAGRIMDRSDVLASPEIGNYKDMLDLIYQEECLPLLG